MRKTIIVLCCLIQTASGFSQKSSAWTLFNSGWEFVRDADIVISASLFNRSDKGSLTWQSVTLPHTARLEPLVLKADQWQGICLYRKFFKVSGADQDTRLSVYFEAAMNDADVYLNGKWIVNHPGGYLPFEVDITGKIKPGKENCLLIKLNNRDNPQIPPGKPVRTLDFSFYGGLYRNVYWVAKDKLHFPDAVASNRKSGGAAMVHFENVGPESATIFITTEIKNDYQMSKLAQIKWTLSDVQGKIIHEWWSERVGVGAGAWHTFNKQIVVSKPNLWSPDQPYLYALRIDLVSEGKLIEQMNLRPGIRSVKFAMDGFYLNGKKLRIRGTNRHQEYPYVGYALPDQAQFRDAWKIKEAGFNFIRCSHYPPSPAFLDACDELGIMVMDAIPGWQIFGDDLFQKNSYQNIRDMVRRDRNHPCIIVWEASLNETGMPAPYMENAHRIVHEELPFPDVYTCGWIDGVYDVFIPARQHAKPPYYWNRYDGSHPLLICEYGDWEYYADNAGFNQTAFKDLKENERTSRQLRGDGEVRLLQQALNYQESHNDNYNGKVVGDANWLMFDYNRGCAPDIESSGIMDIFRLPKFAFWFYQSQAGPVPDSRGFGKPMVFIANYYEDASPDEIRIFSNCDEVALSLNGKLVARQKPDTNAYSKNLPHPPFTFKIPGFEPGTLKATGYIQGEKVTETKRTTAGKAIAVELKADISGMEVKAGKPDLIFIYASLTDVNGVVVHRDSLPVRFSVKGKAELIGDNPIRAEAGIATILLKTNGAGENIIIEAEAAGLKPAILLVPGKKAH